jgi:hypothetical protein
MRSAHHKRWSTDFARSTAHIRSARSTHQYLGGPLTFSLQSTAYCTLYCRCRTPPTVLCFSQLIFRLHFTAGVEHYLSSSSWWYLTLSSPPDRLSCRGLWSLLIEGDDCTMRTMCIPGAKYLFGGPYDMFVWYATTLCFVTVFVCADFARTCVPRSSYVQ